jgi:hypothetical protein
MIAQVKVSHRGWDKAEHFKFLHYSPRIFQGSLE